MSETTGKQATIFLALLLLPPARSVGCQSFTRDSASIEAYIRPYVTSNNFSGQILIARGGKVIFNKAYGTADRERNAPNTLDTEFHIASVSMQFTAAAIMRLIDMGKLALDTRVSDIVPTVRGGDRITIRNLLEERSGLSDINQRPDYTDILAHHQTPASLVSIISSDTLLFAPGSKYLHEEHSAYNLLALIIEKKTGAPFALALRRLVFDPLHMTHSGVDDDNVSSISVARGYSPDGVYGLTPIAPIHWSAKTGNASVYLSSSDELRWVDALFKSNFLSSASRNLVVDSTGPRVGYGWFRATSSRFGQFAYYMNGRSPGFASFVLHLPRSDLTVVLLSNVYSSVPTDMGNDIVAVLLGKPYKPFVIGPALTPAALAELDSRSFTFGADFYQPNATLSFSAKANELFLLWPGGNLSPMIPISPDHFIDRAYGEPVTIERDSAGKPVAISYGRFRGTAK
jgi:CubicO group peptidase (beta-lactamase class C family)